MKFQIIFLIPLACILHSCDQKKANSNQTLTDSAMYKSDPHSFAKPDEAVVKHLDLDIVVDFETKLLSGTATCKIENLKSVRQIILDSRDLTISKVTMNKDAVPVSFSLSEPVKYLGSALTISISPQTEFITIHYTTRPDAGALQWISKEQTAGKKAPFFFTQSQAILARTWVPCQDGPGMRFTYSATVHVPKGLMALMSAENPVALSNDGVYRFNMPQPIPAYLLALAVGDMVFKPVGKLTGVYAEPVTIDKAVYEFADLEKMVMVAEKLYGAYEWGRYDLLVLPPSFPFGGMENPRLTFCTPTILAGDRSLVSLVAHELAHSWSGNLVTNANWNDFWMNEGFTVYFENRIMEALYGKPFSEMQALLGLEDLRETVDELGYSSEDTHLKLNLNDRDPDDGVSDIAYEKGRFLLLLIEQTVGRERFDAFLKNYFQKHKFQSITTEQFLAEYKKDLIQDDHATASKIDIERWVYGPGIPDNCPVIISERFNDVDKSVEAWKKGTPAKKLDTKDYSSNEWQRFLRSLPEKMTMKQMTELDEAYHFTKSGNAEILCIWLEHAIAAQYTPAYPALEIFLENVGRRKFCKPLYKAMAKSPEGLAYAKKIYAKARPNYHSVTWGTIDEILDWK